MKVEDQSDRLGVTMNWMVEKEREKLDVILLLWAEQVERKEEHKSSSSASLATAACLEGHDDLNFRATARVTSIKSAPGAEVRKKIVRQKHVCQMCGQFRKLYPQTYPQAPIILQPALPLLVQIEEAKK